LGDEQPSELIEDFDWTVRRDSWRPRTRPNPPFGPTVVEVLRSCALRRCFEVSAGYQRRQAPSGRIGTAFHQAIQSLPVNATATDAAQAASERFETAMRQQQELADHSPRERLLVRDEKRVQRAMEAAILDGVRRRFTGERARETQNLRTTEAEVEVFSADGMFRGFIDRVERRADGIHIVDYKTALRSDLPERYERQLQMYAAMWADSRGEWPVTAALEYPLIASVIEVQIDQAVCSQTMQAARRVVANVQKEEDEAKFAKPGDACKICEFRPWCEPFWNWQSEIPSVGIAYERANLGFEGEVTAVVRTKSTIALTVRWRDLAIRLTMRPDRFPFLSHIVTGEMVRALDFTIRGVPTGPRAIENERSEVYLVS